MRWLLLIHQIPSKPSYLRVKCWRRLQRLGAIPIKGSVYAMPRTEQAQEDLQWIRREIVEGGGEASLCEARFVDGMTDAEVEGVFRSAREADYERVADDVRQLARTVGRRPAAARRGELTDAVLKHKRRLAEIVAIDFFGAPGREAADGLLAELERRLAIDAPRAAEPAVLRKGDYAGRTWVTRRGIHVDRIASAWLIRRFIDPAPTFRFVVGKGYQPAPGELRFDMFEAEFTHEGDRCTFEVLVRRFGLRDRALAEIAEIIHDIDLKDAKFDRPDTAGIDRLILGIAMGTADDTARLARGSEVLDGLYDYFTRKG